MNKGCHFYLGELGLKEFSDEMLEIFTEDQLSLLINNIGQVQYLDELFLTKDQELCLYDIMVRMPKFADKDQQLYIFDQCQYLNNENTQNPEFNKKVQDISKQVANDVNALIRENGGVNAMDVPSEDLNQYVYQILNHLKYQTLIDEYERFQGQQIKHLMPNLVTY